jgi:hypothetical protein
LPTESTDGSFASFDANAASPVAVAMPTLPSSLPALPPAFVMRDAASPGRVLVLKTTT